MKPINIVTRGYHQCVSEWILGVRLCRVSRMNDRGFRGLRFDLLQGTILLYSGTETSPHLWWMIRSPAGHYTIIFWHRNQSSSLVDGSISCRALYYYILAQKPVLISGG